MYMHCDIDGNFLFAMKPPKSTCPIHTIFPYNLPLPYLHSQHLCLLLLKQFKFFIWMTYVYELNVVFVTVLFVLT